MARVCRVCLVCLCLLLGGQSVASPTTAPSRVVKRGAPKGKASSRPLAGVSPLRAAQKRALAKLLQAAKAKTWRKRYDAALGLARFPGKKGWSGFGAAHPQVYALLTQMAQKDSNFWVRMGGVRALAALRTKGVKVILFLARKDKQSEVRHEALVALRTMTIPPKQEAKANEVLYEAIKDKPVRLTAAQTIARLTGNPMPMLQIMVSFLESSVPVVRHRSAGAFAKLSAREKLYAVDMLIGAASTDDEAHRAAITEALVALGQMAKPWLKRAKASKDARVRAVVAAALKRL